MIRFFKSHGTKILGFLQGSIAVIAGTTGLLPDHQLKWWLAASGLLTFWRGFVNNKNGNPS